MTPLVITRWVTFMESGDPTELDTLIATDAVFHSPAVFTPQAGREKVSAYLLAAEKMFSNANFRYTDQWFDDRSAVLEFAAEIEGLTVEGIDLIRWNDADQIVSFKVMVRPLKALQSIVPIMGELLGRGS